MKEKLIKGIIGLTTSIKGIHYIKEITIFIISMLPILELRGGLIAASLLDMNPIESYIICIIGNIIPVPFILWFVQKILNWMRKTKLFKKFVLWLDKKVEKNKGQIEKYGYLGLVLFVGIPLPGTGAWTGCLIATVLEMDKKKSFFATLAGIFIASIIMMLVSFGIIGRIF